MATHYQVLNVTQDADPVVIAAAYKALMKRHHPDASRDATTEIASKLNEAYRVLSNARRRAAYDRQIGIARRPAATANHPYRPGFVATPATNFDYFGQKGTAGAAEDRPPSFRGMDPGTEGFLGKKSGTDRRIILIAILCAMVPVGLLLWMARGVFIQSADRPAAAAPAAAGPLPGQPLADAETRRPAPLVGGERPRTSVMFVAEGTMRVAPLRVTGTRGSDYYLKLVDDAGQRDVLTLFVRGGETLETRVPAGRYRMRYASGNQWLGAAGLFGPDTRFAAANSVSDFGGDGRPVTAYDITLGRPAGGSSEGRAIGREDF